MSITLKDFNTHQTAAVKELIASCAPINSWSAALLARRPYSSRQDLLQMASSLTQDWTDKEVDGALAHHPRIGERAKGDSAEARASREEQAALGEDAAAREEWVAANHDYERTFDRIFLIRAKGRSRAEMMAQLRQRLNNDAATEAQVRREQLAEIALLRLEDAVTD